MQQRHLWTVVVLLLAVAVGYTIGHYDYSLSRVASAGDDAKPAPAPPAVPAAKSPWQPVDEWDGTGKAPVLVVTYVHHEVLPEGLTASSSWDAVATVAIKDLPAGVAGWIAIKDLVVDATGHGWLRPDALALSEPDWDHFTRIVRFEGKGYSVYPALRLRKAESGAPTGWLATNFAPLYSRNASVVVHGPLPKEGQSSSDLSK